MAEILNILKFTHGEEFSYDREKVLDCANTLAGCGLLTITERMDLNDIVREVFELTYDSLLGNELFYGLSDFDVAVELSTRMDDE